MSAKKKGFVNFLQEFSIPLISGVIVALVFANVSPETYEHVIHWSRSAASPCSGTG